MTTKAIPNKLIPVIVQPTRLLSPKSSCTVLGGWVAVGLGMAVALGIGVREGLKIVGEGVTGMGVGETLGVAVAGSPRLINIGWPM